MTTVIDVGSLPSEGKVTAERSLFTSRQRGLFTCVVVLLLAVIAVVAVVYSTRPVILDAWGTTQQQMLAKLDTSAEPCHNFYQFACGGVPENPEEANSASLFSPMASDVLQTVNSMLDDPQTELERKIATWHGSCVDTDGIDDNGLVPFAADLLTLAAASDMDDLWSFAARVQRLDGRGLLQFVPDSLQPMRTGFYRIEVGGADGWQFEITGGPAWKDVILSLMTLVGDATPQLTADRVYNASYELALQSTRAPRDGALLEGAGQLWSVSQLAARAPGIPWSTWLAALGVASDDLDAIIAPQLDVIGNMSVALGAAGGPLSVEGVRALLKYHYLVAVQHWLPTRARELLHGWYASVLGASNFPDSRERLCTNLVTTYMSDAVAEAYVERKLDSQSSSLADDMLRRVHAQFRSGVLAADWLDGPSRDSSLSKLDAMLHHVGLEDAALRTNYDDVTLSAGDAFANFAATRLHDWNVLLALPGERLDQRRWVVQTAQVNAFYHPVLNIVAFPAGILQPGLFSRLLPAAYNYGGMGSIMGHEITHGFDVTGSQYDAAGQLNSSFWTDSTDAAFSSHANCFRNAFDDMPSYGWSSQLDSLLFVGGINGSRTLGENMADTGGTKFAYLALREALKSQSGIDRRPLEGYTVQQTFWISWAQTWCGARSATQALIALQVDVHANGRSRVNGPLMQSSQFASDFQCSSSDHMVPTERCTLW